MERAAFESELREQGYGEVVRHSDRSGPDGARYLAGRRYAS